MKLNIEIDLTNDDRAAISQLANFLTQITNAARRPAVHAQPEVASNTGSDTSGLPLSPEGVVVTGAAIASASDAQPEAAPVPVISETVKDAVRVVKKRQAKAMDDLGQKGEADAPKPVEQPAQEPEKIEVPALAHSLTLDDVRGALQKFTESRGVPAGIELLKEFGAARVSELKEGQFASFIEKAHV